MKAAILNHFVCYKKRVTEKRRDSFNRPYFLFPNEQYSLIDYLAKKGIKISSFSKYIIEMSQNFQKFTNALCLKDLGQQSLHSWQLKNAKTFSTLFDMCNLSLLIP